MNSGAELYKKAKKIIPGGTQLLSKRPEMFLPEHWPSYYSCAKGCEVWDLDGNRYIDTSIFNVGSNVLGYAYEPVDNAAKAAIDASGTCTLNAPEEIELAETLLDLHSWADMVRYAKAGGESMAVAVRIARAHTRRDVVLSCGYHGWHDWYLAANLTKGDSLAGVHLAGLEPLGVSAGLSGSNLIFHYNDFETFMKLLTENDGKIAAVVVEPIRNDPPDDNFLMKIREETAKRGIVLIFDEITAGFRLCCGGSHLTLGVEPDIAVFAKAMANGYPIAAIIGRGEVMTAAEGTFISSSFWTERVALAAAVVAIREFKRLNLQEHLTSIGKRVQEGWESEAWRCGLKLDIGGIYPLSHFAFSVDDALACMTYFTQEMLKRGYLASAQFYVSLAHTEPVVDKYLRTCGEVFMEIERLQRGAGVKGLLKGPVRHSGFARLN